MIGAGRIRALTLSKGPGPGVEEDTDEKDRHTRPHAQPWDSSQTVLFAGISLEVSLEVPPIWSGPVIAFQNELQNILELLPPSSWGDLRDCIGFLLYRLRFLKELKEDYIPVRFKKRNGYFFLFKMER